MKNYNEEIKITGFAWADVMVDRVIIIYQHGQYWTQGYLEGNLTGTQGSWAKLEDVVSSHAFIFC